jgi:hypothetical protein
MRGLVSILMLALSSVLATLASIWMAPAAPVIRAATWLSDRATRLLSHGERGGRP